MNTLKLMYFILNLDSLDVQNMDFFQLMCYFNRYFLCKIFYFNTVYFYVTYPLQQVNTAQVILKWCKKKINAKIFFTINNL